MSGVKIHSFSKTLHSSPEVWPLLDVNSAPFPIATETAGTGRLPGTIPNVFLLLPDEDSGILLTGEPDLTEHFAQPKKTPTQNP